MISGPSEPDVREALDMLVNEDGAKVASYPAKLGSLWLAACSHPLHAPAPCKVRQEGLTIIVTGPTEQAVTVAMLEIKDRGGSIIEPPYEIGGDWIAVLEGVELGHLERLAWSKTEYRR